MDTDHTPISELEHESLEQPATELASTEKPLDNTAPPANSSRAPKKSRFHLKQLKHSINIYSLAFVIIILAIVGVVVYFSRANTKVDETAAFGSQELTTEALQKLRNTDTSVGDAKQTLTIAANAVFNNRVLVRGDLDVAGAIKVAGNLDLPGITVSGISTFETMNINKTLSVGNNTTIQGQLIVQQTLSVNGDATFNGTVSASKVIADSIQFNQNLVFQKHIDSGGPTPSITTASPLGSGATSSINGTDTAGTVTLNSGASPSAGIVASVTFKTAFSQTPHIQITPVGAEAASLNYYVTRTTTGFAIGTTNAPTTGTTYIFDYLALE